MGTADAPRAVPGLGGIPIFPAPPVPGTVPGVTVPVQGWWQGTPWPSLPTLWLLSCHLLPAPTPTAVYQAHNQASVPRRLLDCPSTPMPGCTRLP